MSAVPHQPQGQWMNPAPSADRLADEERHLSVYALVRLRDPSLAAQAVRDTLAAARQALPTFQGGRSLRAWLVSILRTKIAEAAAEGGGRSPTAENLQSLFDEAGMWQPARRPRAWGQAEASLQEPPFGAVFGACLQRMPDSSAEVFTLREMLGESIEEISETLGIAPGECSAMLYGARMRLRTCLDEEWFARGGGS